MSIEARIATAQEFALCSSVRHEVFVQEQKVPAELELDGQDPHCQHFVAFLDGTLAGTARLRITDDGHAKAERVAVLIPYRGRGLGHALMQVLEDSAKAGGHAEVVLSAQVDAIPFYLARCYVEYGFEFIEVGIRHKKMRFAL